MTTTPPLQIVSSPITPSTPLHGAAYDRPRYFPTRRSTRLNARTNTTASRSTPDALRHNGQFELEVKTPGSARPLPGKTSPLLHSPQTTPMTRASRRVQVVSPTSPDLRPFDQTHYQPGPSHLQPLLSSTTTLSEGMLPTPVKTPRKKTMTGAGVTARALFQDAAQPGPGTHADELQPRRQKKNKRHNGFSLESFEAHKPGEGRGQIQIFTDSRDRVPQLDKNKANPFIERHMNGEQSTTRPIPGTSKRRKVTASKRMDTQVEEAIRKDDGMVYVFRGRKVYRRFEDESEEEEVIEDADDLGLLEHNTHGKVNTSPMKTLSRRSIKPKRLFESETQKRAREAEKEEEAMTDIEVDANVDAKAANGTLPSKTANATTRSKSSRILRSSRGGHLTSDESESDKEEPGARQGHKASPFDSWPRVRSGRSGGLSKGKKRDASDLLDESAEVQRSEAKKTRV